MDFFEYANLVSAFVSFRSRWITYLVGGLCYLIVFIFSAMALWTISGREGYKHRWMSFVPILDTYYIGVCGQKNRMFRMNTKIVAIVAASVELCCVVVNILYYTGFEMLISNGNLIEITNDYYTEYMLVGTVPSSLAWAEWMVLNSETYITWWLEIIYLLLDIAILYCFFQTYAARRYFIFTLTSILFPIQGIIFYTIRNNKGMAYADFMKKQQEQQYQMYQQYNRQNPNGGNNPYDDPYNQNPYSRRNRNDYGQGQGGDEPPAGDDPYDLGGSGSSGDDDPFSEFGSGDDDPFS